MLIYIKYTSQQSDTGLLESQFKLKQQFISPKVYQVLLLYMNNIGFMKCFFHDYKLLNS